MENEQTTRIDPTRVRERIKEYLTNRGYQTERTFSPERLGIYFEDNLGNRHEGYINSSLWTAILPTAPQHNFWANMGVLMGLRKLFKPVERVYQEGKQLYSKASVLTPKYAQLSQENQLAIQNFEISYSDAIKEIENKYKGIKRWLLTRRIKSLKNFSDKIFSYTHSSLPSPVPRETGISALSGLYGWLQVGEEDSDSKKARDDLAHSSGQLTEDQTLSLGVEGDLYKIKNHAAIVCLDQLKQDGLTLDAVVSQEIDKIPREYLRDIFYWNENVSAPFRLRTGNPDSFGAGLFDRERT